MKTIEKNKKITWIPPLTDNELGWISIDKVCWVITNWHTFDDFGQTVDTLTIKNPFTGEQKEVFSNDEGETFAHTI